MIIIDQLIYDAMKRQTRRKSLRQKPRLTWNRSCHWNDGFYCKGNQTVIPKWPFFSYVQVRDLLEFRFTNVTIKVG